MLLHKTSHQFDDFVNKIAGKVLFTGEILDGQILPEDYVCK